MIHSRLTNLLVVLFILNTTTAICQLKFTAIDTIASNTCGKTLTHEYENKFSEFNKAIAASGSSELNIIKKMYKDVQEDFLEKIDNMNFICTDISTSYLTGLMNEVLEKNNIDAKEYKILLSKNPEANAYNTGDGTIVINYGLFLTIENEDELVFVISHEIGHQYLNHVKNDIYRYAKLFTSDEITKKTKEIKKQKYGRATLAEDMLKKLQYQNYSERRRKEIEADSLGFALYRKTNRNLTAPVTTLQKLEVSDIERDSLIISDYKKIFNINGYVLRQSYFEKEEVLFKKYDSYFRINPDSLKTHPDCVTRIKIINNFMDSRSHNTSNKITGYFDGIKKNAIYQNLLNMYNLQHYGMCLYEALKLYKHNHEDSVIKEIIAMNLDKIYTAKINYTINRYLPKSDNKNNTDSLNRFITFINNLRKEDFPTIINNFKS